MFSVALLTSLLTISWIASIFIHKGAFIPHKQKSLNAQKFLLFSTPALLFGFIFVALKPFSAGGDTYSYLVSFSKIGNPLTATSDADYGPELLFWPTQAIIKIFVDARGWYIVNFIITSTLYYIAYKKLTKGTNISPLIFSLVFLTYYVVYGGNAMRQVYSIPLGIIAFHYAYNKKHLKYLTYSILSIAFHWSAFVAILFPLIIKVPNRNLFYIGLPAGALSLSMLIIPAAEKLISYIHADWLLIKLQAYVFGIRTSHISEIWLTLNFWLCTVTYFFLVGLKITSNHKYEKILKYILLFFCLMLFSINNTDISDRYMVHFLFVIPIAIILIISTLQLPTIFKNITLLLAFCTMCILVYTRHTTIIALGIPH